MIQNQEYVLVDVKPCLKKIRYNKKFFNINGISY